MSVKSIIVCIALSATALTTAKAEELDQTDLGGFPAVSAFNGKLSVGYAKHGIDSQIFDDLSAKSVKGTVSMPLAERFGVQIDAGVQEGEMDTLFGPLQIDLSSRGVGAHVFWRDPSRGLLGAYGHYETHDLEFSTVNRSVKMESSRLGAEAEYYHRNWTVKGFAGIDRLDVDFSGVGGPELDDSFFAGQLEVGYYVSENALVSVGINHSFDQTIGTLGMGFLLNTGAASPTAFANASSSDGTISVMGGLKLMFGPEEKSLMRRHREDDPANGVFGGTGQMMHCFTGTYGIGGSSLDCTSNVGDGPA